MFEYYFIDIKGRESVIFKTFKKVVFYRKFANKIMLLVDFSFFSLVRLQNLNRPIPNCIYCDTELKFSRISEN